MRASCKDLTLIYAKNAQKRVGFSVSKKVGGAVVRNLVKAPHAGMRSPAASGSEKRFLCHHRSSFLYGAYLPAAKKLHRRDVAETISGAARGQAMNTILIRMIRFYQKRISTHTRSSCRFVPTCSEYAVTALRRFGTVKGLRLAVWRILRCNPFGKGGYDPVPENTDATIRRN